MSHIKLNNLPSPHPRMSVDDMLSNGYTLDAIEAHVRKWAIIKVLNQEHGNQCAAAERLGKHRNTIARMIDDLHINLNVRGTRRALSVIAERDPQLGRRAGEFKRRHDVGA